MKFFISLKLSHKDVAVSHYRDDDGKERLLPFRGCDRAMPLAVAIVENRVIVGQEALNRNEQNLPDSFYKLFSFLEGNYTYTRYGERKPAQHLIYLAIDTLLDNLLRNEFNISIDEAKSELPIGFDFAPDVSTEERKAVLSLFTSGYKGECGRYGNVGVIDTNKIIADEALNGNYRNYAMVLDSNGTDILASMYSKDSDNCIGSAIFHGLGVDPRVAMGVKVIKESVMSVEPFIDFSPVEARMQEMVTDFIASGRMEYFGNLTINDYDYTFFLQKAAISNPGYSHSGNLRAEVRNFTNRVGGVNLEDIIFAIRGISLQSDYFTGVFKSEFSCVKIVDEKTLKELDATVIRDMVNCGWTLDPSRRIRKELDEEFKDLKMYIEKSLIPDGKLLHAKEELKIYLQKAASYEYSEHDEHVRSLIEHIDELVRRRNEKDEAENEGKKANGGFSVEDVENKSSDFFSFGDRRSGKKSDENSLAAKWESFKNDAVRNINQFLQAGDTKSAREEFSTLEESLHAEGVTEYDSLLDGLREKLRPQNRRPVGGSQEKPAEKKAILSPAEQAVANFEYGKASRLYAADDDMDKAVIMGKLDKAYKKFSLAKKGFQTYVSEKNRNSLSIFAEDIKLYVSLLKEASLPTNDAENLLEQYLNALDKC